MSSLLLFLIGCNPEGKTTIVDTGNLQAEPTSEPSTTEETEETGETDIAETGDSEETGDTGETGETELECIDQIQPVLEWFQTTESAEMMGEVSFAQTHVVREEEARWAPELITHRSMMLFLEPESTIESTQDMRVAAFRDGELLGVLPMNSPELQPSILEQGLTTEALDAWSETAWSVFIPYHWVEAGVSFQIGYEEEGVLYQRDIALGKLAAPHVFTLSRAKILLFGDASFDTTTIASTRLSQDFFATLPLAELRWVDSTPWVLDEIVVNGAEGPVLVSSEGDRLALTTDPDRWNILKLIFTHRMSLANIGKGLYNTNFGGGNSPYSFGTSLGLGWVRNDDGSYSDINNAPYSAGWTGWSSIWHGECGNVFNHEVGHSMTLAHFTAGSAASWGIDEQYPLNGENLEYHPWGFDTTRKMFRSWYRVNSSGIAYKDDGSIQGKRDSMNGGESSNAITCFPQYTAYHSWKIQDWAQSTPTFREESGQVGIFVWNLEHQNYEAYQPTEFQQQITGLHQPAATIVGSLGLDANTNILYPPMYWESANLFAFPDPQDTGLTGDFDGANYYLKISYQDGSEDYALINKETVTNTDISLFSLNIDLRRVPQALSLYHSETSYPNLDYSLATELYTRTLNIPSALEPIVLSGKGSLANGTLVLTERCEAGVNCEQRMLQSFWRNGAEDIYFTTNTEAPTLCAEQGSFTSLTVNIQDEAGNTDIATVNAQRVVRTQSDSWETILNDQTSWTSQANKEQGIKVWLPYEENQHLSEGIWRGETTITMWTGAEASEISFRIETEVVSTELVDVSSSFESGALSVTGSSLYFILTDPTIGPTSRVWWGSSDPTLLTIPVVDQATGQVEILRLNAWKKTCNLGWGTMWSLNSGQVSDDCTYQVYLELPSTGNEQLQSGHTYRSPASQPIIFEGRYWHQPANELAGRFAYRLEYSVP